MGPVLWWSGSSIQSRYGHVHRHRTVAVDASIPDLDGNGGHVHPRFRDRDGRVRPQFCDRGGRVHPLYITATDVLMDVPVGMSVDACMRDRVTHMAVRMLRRHATTRRA